MEDLHCLKFLQHDNKFFCKIDLNIFQFLLIIEKTGQIFKVRKSLQICAYI